MSIGRLFCPLDIHLHCVQWTQWAQWTHCVHWTGLTKSSKLTNWCALSGSIGHIKMDPMDVHCVHWTCPFCPLNGHNVSIVSIGYQWKWWTIHSDVQWTSICIGRPLCPLHWSQSTLDTLTTGENCTVMTLVWCYHIDAIGVVTWILVKGSLMRLVSSTLSKRLQVKVISEYKFPRTHTQDRGCTVTARGSLL